MCLDVPKCNIGSINSIDFIPMAFDKMSTCNTLGGSKKWQRGIFHI